MNFVYGSKIQYALVSGVFFFYDEGLLWNGMIEYSFLWSSAKGMFFASIWGVKVGHNVGKLEAILCRMKVSFYL